MFCMYVFVSEDDTKLHVMMQAIISGYAFKQDIHDLIDQYEPCHPACNFCPDQLHARCLNPYNARAPGTA